MTKKQQLTFPTVNKPAYWVQLIVNFGRCVEGRAGHDQRFVVLVAVFLLLKPQLLFLL